MPDAEREMQVYLELADFSQQKQQLLGRDKFLILAAAAACRAGWPSVAEQCRELVLENNRSHLVGRFARFTDAMRDDDFEPFLKQLERFCGYERAEHLLATLEIDPGGPATEDAGERAAEIFARPHWSKA
jgi:hypothetical protein